MLSGERDKVELANKLLENPKEALRLLSERVGVPLATEKPADSSTSDTGKMGSRKSTCGYSTHA